MNSIYVAMCSDDFYAPFVATTIASILLHTNESVHFYVLSNGITDKNKKLIKECKDINGKSISIDFIEIEKKELECIDDTDFISSVAISRFLIPDLIDQDRIIYTDIDVSFVGDIADLWNEDLGEYSFAAVPSQRASINNNYAEFRERFGISKEHRVFMDGLLLINLRQWREMGYGKKLLNIARDNKIYDQEAMNIFFDGKTYKELDVKYCVIYKIFDECYDIETIEKIRREQIIVHYPGKGKSKPWYNSDLRSARYFWRSVKKTAFSNAISRRYGIWTEDELVKTIKNYNNIIVYGAGVVGRLVLDVLQKEEYELDNIYIAVTDIENNPKVVSGIRVNSIDNLETIISDSTVVVVAVDIDNARQIEISLTQRGVKNIIVISNRLRKVLEKDNCVKLLDDLILSTEKKVQCIFTLFDFSIDIVKIPKARGSIRDLQKADTLLLKIFHDFCQENGFKYWLMYGTLLGAFRHKGFIPWDDDIDIAMPRDDYNKFESIFRQSFSKFGLIINHGEGYHYQVIRVVYGNTGVQLDIWPFDCTNQSDINKEKFIKRLNLCNSQIYKKYPMSGLYRDGYDIVAEELGLIRNEILGEECCIEEAKYVYAGAEALIDGNEYIYKVEDIFPFIELQFEDGIFFAPHNSEKILTDNYGDFYLFPRDKILGHENINNNLLIENSECRYNTLKKIYHEYKNNK